VKSAAGALPVALLALLPVAGAGGDTLPDPMRPPMPRAAPGAAERRPEPVLTAVRQQGSERVAVFNGELVRPGDTVAGCRVLAILPDGIRLLRDGHVQELHLPHPFDDIKKPAAMTAHAAAGESAP